MQKNNKKHQFKTLLFNWQFVVLLMFFIILIFGFSPIDFFKQSFGASNKKTNIINLYATNYSSLKVDNYKNGWWNIDRAVGAPDLANNSGLINFSDNNSSFYTGGNYSIEFNKFNILKEEIEEEVEEENIDEKVNIEEEIKEEEVEVEEEVEEEVEVEEEIIDKKVNVKEEVKEEEEEEEEEVIDEKVNIEEEFKEVEVKEVEIIDNINLDQGEMKVLDFDNDIKIEIQDEEEIIDKKVNIEKKVKEEAEEEIEIIKVDEINEVNKNIDLTNKEISFLDKIKNIFKKQIVIAQEYIINEIEKLSDLGKLKSAKIKFSLGYSIGNENRDQESIIKNKEVEEVEETKEIDLKNYIEKIEIEEEVEVEDEVKKEVEETEIDENIIDSEKVNQIKEDVKKNEIIENKKDIKIREDEEISFLDKFIKQAKAENNLDKAKIIIWYSLDNSLWKKLDVLKGDKLSNQDNNEYFSYKAEFLENWDDINNLKIKFEGVYNGEKQFMAYLDSVWVEVEYEAETELDKIEKRQRWKNALNLLSNKLTFKAGEKAEFRFRYNKNEKRIWDTLSEIVGLGNFWKNVELKAKLIDSSGKIVDHPLEIIFEEDGEFFVRSQEVDKKLKPGKYSIKFLIIDNSGDEEEIFNIKQDFSWGVLAMNFNKAIYKKGEQGYIQMAVLDKLGHTICDADLKLSIKTPTGNIVVLDNNNKINKINNNKECGPETVINLPDYFAYYDFINIGEYEFTLLANTNNQEKIISEKIKVVENLDLDIERISSTRIFPKADYDMIIKINTKKYFKGDITETVPVGFKIMNYELRIINNNEKDPFGANYKFYKKEDNQNIKLIWQDIELSAGDELEIKYKFDAPNKSPEFYLLGGLEMNMSNKIQIETRKWQIASDSISKRAKTVMFMAGTYSGDGSTGRSANTNYTFPVFNFRLAETGVDIKNAFIIFESHFEAYNNTGGNYTGYNLAFDACDQGSGANAFLSSDKILDDNNDILVYDGSESNQTRLLLDVTNESQIANYTGGGEKLEGQVGYRLENSSGGNSISNAKAVLILTYIYDEDSENITNTVVYPLESNRTGDNGSRQILQASDCTLGSDCPTFSYKMEIPEFPSYATSTYRLSDWFKMSNANDSNRTRNIDVNVRVNTGAMSNNFHHESNNSTQSFMPNHYFVAVDSYDENSIQNLEYSAQTGLTGDDHYLIGGEVFETYIASTSVATSTRTVSFPLGVINDGQTTACTSKSVDVYFPENGSATGTVKIKKAWIRILSNHAVSGAKNIQVSTKAGNNTVSATSTYNYNPGADVPKTSFNVFHIIQETDYTAIEEANANTGVAVTVNTQNNDSVAGVTSAELMITYTYTSELSGYLSSLQLFGGQSTGVETSTTTIIANSVAPESSNKTMLAGALLVSYLTSAIDGNVGASSIYELDANVGITTPSCTESSLAQNDTSGYNSFYDFYRDVTSGLTIDDNQSYYACYKNDEPLTSNDRAKMNGILFYTYQWENSAPTSTFESIAQKTDGSGVVDIAIEAYDLNKHDLKIKIEYATGTTCIFSNSDNPYLDETDENITADFGDPNIDNNNIYQIGTIDSYITTASGSNSILFDWISSNDLPNTEGDYCIRITANDLNLDQENPATSTIYIDNIIPTTPGILSLNSRTGSSVTLNFGATSTETNFNEYKIFYKQFDGTAPIETDDIHSSSTDINLNNILYNNLSTTTISDLTAGITYSFAIWVYDDYGNRASSTWIDIKTNDAPTGIFNIIDTKQKINGSGIVDISIEVVDNNNDNTNTAKIEYSIGNDCDFSLPLDPTIDETQENIQADFGIPIIDNNQNYQIGSSSGYILTSAGSNTVNFDWQGKNNQPFADGEYCLRLTVNDSLDDQLSLATTTITLDNITPTSTGVLISGDVNANNIELIFATSSPGQDTNEPILDAYKIFYKEGISGVTESDSEHDNSNLNYYNYNNATSTIILELDQNTWYTFNIWTYDSFGNKASSTEIAIKTNATISNDSLEFTNATSSNVVLAGSGVEWNFKATVSESNGWYAIASTTLRLANKNDYTSPFSDLEFYWDQTTNSFYEIGNDILNSAILSSNSTSTCSGITCELDFKIIVNKNFASSSIDYVAELYSINDSGVIDEDNYNNFYQVRFPYTRQIHYRWRNDDGGE